MSGARRGFQFADPVYPIVDAGQQRRSPLDLADRLLSAGARLLQLRAKDLTTREVCDLARALQARVAAQGGRLIINDRADVARLVGAAGVHLGQTDLHPDDARRILGPEAVIGYSTHNEEQVCIADRLASLDYLGFGPIFPTTNKADSDPCQGLGGLRAARALTPLPIVAIGGIGFDTAASVLGAGADAVAMIGAFASADDPGALFRRVAGR